MVFVCSLTRIHGDGEKDEDRRERYNRGIKCDNFLYSYLVFAV